MNKYEIYIFGHHNFEPTGKYLHANNNIEAWYQLKWIYPILPNAALELKEKEVN